ncbi:hypothetical protein M0812_28899 [Anaeramoeba flamelloides]|uniref:Uncharacterized protein n=1 Tax=Anaeramoeba flamelloides TaxID=1746091 RepID=A0AAV7Y9H6_9EUKA|nr:hypothetical protein M0812_28899 [Anaeramoeba flamelloides]
MNVNTVMEQEPVIEKTKTILSLLSQYSNQRLPLKQLSESTISPSSTIVAHGTNFSAVLSSLLNSNGQLLSISEMEKTEINSKASLIPAIVVGELLDPKGIGKKLNTYFQNPFGNDLAKLPKKNPLYRKRLEEVKEIFVDQVIGIRINIQGIYVSSPNKSSENEKQTLELVTKIVQQVSLEQEIDYSYIYIGLIKNEVTKFKETMEPRRDVTFKEICEHFFTD